MQWTLILAHWLPIDRISDYILFNNVIERAFGIHTEKGSLVLSVFSFVFDCRPTVSAEMACRAKYNISKIKNTFVIYKQSSTAR